MHHVVEVDQCRKIEQSGATVLAFSNDISRSILIPSRVKNAGLNALRARGKPREIAQILLFSACLYLLLKNHLSDFRKVVIDQEYPGHEHNIRSALIEYIKKAGKTFELEKIEFTEVGRKSPADKKARDVRAGKDKDYQKISFSELLDLVA